MKKRRLVRLELAALAVLTLLLVYRLTRGDSPPAGAVVFSNIEAESLQHSAIAVEQTLRLRIDAVGSFESTEVINHAGRELAAYGWILRRSDRNVVWKLSGANAAQDRGTLAAVRDTVTLTPGIYDVFFTSYGNRRSGSTGFSILDRILGTRESWRNESGKWRLAIRPELGRNGIETLRIQSGLELAPSGENLFWTSAPMEGQKRSEHVFQVLEPTAVRVYAIGEIDRRRQMDFGWIDDAITGEREWEMSLSNTVPAGGWSVNRLADDTLRFDPGMYRAVFQTDARQSYDDWVGNPPNDPAAWGMSLFAAQPTAVAAFDPWTERRPIIELIRIGDSERRSVQFKVDEPLAVAIDAMGEMSRGSRYDYAWLRDNDSQETVWEMTPERSRHAGGHEYNRTEMAFLDLRPSTYTLYYESDDSHAYETWNKDRPDFPERWGVALFPVRPEFDSTAVEILAHDRSVDEHAEHADIPPVPAPPSPATGPRLVNLTGIKNDQQVSARFRIDEPTMVRIRALGEISISGQYDYGWLERARTNETVWEMSWQNTSPAGGDDRNRRFDGEIRLEPGEYVAHYKTDFSHAAGDFGEKAPSDPHNWGLVIERTAGH